QTLYDIVLFFYVFFFFFFFQAEDGIRDFHVTGVQTCALPIYDGRTSFLSLSGPPGRTRQRKKRGTAIIRIDHPRSRSIGLYTDRSEERRVGKECRARRWQDYGKKK